MSVVEPAGGESQAEGTVASGGPPEPASGGEAEIQQVKEAADGGSQEDVMGGGDPRDKDIKELLKELGQGVTTLLRQEIELIKAELAEKTDAVRDEVQDTITEVRLELEVAKAELAEAGKKAGVGAGLFGTAGLLGLGAFGAFTGCLVALFSLAMPVWVGALLVTLLYGAVGGGLALAGRKQVKEVELPVPETVKRLRALLESGKTRVQKEVAPMPQEIVEPLKNVKEEAQQAWQRGGEKP
jgi:hypothetical protein